MVISLIADILWFFRFILDEETKDTELAAGITTAISCIAIFFRLFLNSSLVSQQQVSFLNFCFFYVTNVDCIQTASIPLETS